MCRNNILIRFNLLIIASQSNYFHVSDYSRMYIVIYIQILKKCYGKKEEDERNSDLCNVSRIMVILEDDFGKVQQNDFYTEFVTVLSLLEKELKLFLLIQQQQNTVH